MSAPSPPTIALEAGNAAPNPAAEIDYRRFLECVHCGMCTSACPTFVETGDENDGPRGRIYLMRGVADGRLEVGPELRRHLELCLDCRACESVCPSGVQYGRIIEPFRVAIEQSSGQSKTSDWFHRWIIYRLFPYPHRLRMALAPARLLQKTGIERLARGLRLDRLLPSRLRQLARLLPPLPRSEPALPEFLPAVGRRRARVALFTGCVGDAMFRGTNWATARVLQQNGCDVVVPRAQACCGAIHYHSGASQPARELADVNLAAFAGDYDAIIVNVAGCGSMLKDYGHHWHDAQQPGRAALAGKVQDVCEFLDRLGLVSPSGEIPLVATYHDACHLVHAQRVREAPRRLLARIPKLVLRELAESELCCGAAGTYNLTEPEMAERLGQRKLANIAATGAEVLIAGNAGCLLQIAAVAREQGRRLSVYHPLELLDLSYRGQQPSL